MPTSRRVPPGLGSPIHVSVKYFFVTVGRQGSSRRRGPLPRVRHRVAVEGLHLRPRPRRPAEELEGAPEARVVREAPDVDAGAEPGPAVARDEMLEHRLEGDPVHRVRAPGLAHDADAVARGRAVIGARLSRQAEAPRVQARRDAADFGEIIGLGKRRKRTRGET